jgi:hypothetical protein
MIGDDGWAPLPKTEKRIRLPNTVQRANTYEVTSKAQLKNKSKEDLVEEVHRLQQLQRDIAVELGIVARSKSSSDFTIHPHFIINITSLIKTGWSFNL